MPPKKKKSSQEKVEEVKVEEKAVEPVVSKGEDKAVEPIISNTAETDLEKEIMADLENLDKDTPIPETSPKVSEPEKKEEVKAEQIAEKMPEPKAETPKTPEPLPTSEPKAPEVKPPLATEPETNAAAPTTPPTEAPVSTPTPPIPPEPNPTAPPSPTPEGDSTTPAPASAEATPEDAEEIPEEEAPPEAAPAEATDGKKKVVLDRATMRNVIEAALFVAGRPISVEELNIKTELKKKDIEDLLKELVLDYMERSTSIEIVQMQEKFSMQVKPQFTQNVKKFASGGLIPEAVLKTLTIIALKQPMMKNMLIKIRGAGAYDHVKFLIERGFITNQKKGRSDELVTTEQFSDTFGLSKDVATLKKQLIAQLGVKEEPEPAPKEG